MRAGHSACVLGKVMYVYGGYNLTGWTNDIYELDTSTMIWSFINTRGAPSRRPRRLRKATFV
ncbi:hypothetical protein IEQ44_16645, partial [Nocardioides sp. Y6]|nr:hypothetical protein [Nocardioides malaquae]